MKSKISAVLPETSPQKVPRLVSLQHRLEHAKDENGEPSSLKDELLFLLEDPPVGTTDRWQDGADMCADHGIQTSRMAVWRFYRANIFQWRREQNPVPLTPIDHAETERLQDQARHLLAQRIVDLLSDPNLPSGHLIALLQNENHRQKIDLARDQFIAKIDDRAYERRRTLQKEQADKVVAAAMAAAVFSPYKPGSQTPPTAPLKSPSIPPHTT